MAIPFSVWSRFSPFAGPANNPGYGWTWNPSLYGPLLSRLQALSSGQGSGLVPSGFVTRSPADAFNPFFGLGATGPQSLTPLLQALIAQHQASALTPQTVPLTPAGPTTLSIPGQPRGVILPPQFLASLIPQGTQAFLPSDLERAAGTIEQAVSGGTGPLVSGPLSSSLSTGLSRTGSVADLAAIAAAASGAPAPLSAGLGLAGSAFGLGSAIGSGALQAALAGGQAAAAIPATIPGIGFSGAASAGLAPLGALLALRGVANAISADREAAIESRYRRQARSALSNLTANPDVVNAGRNLALLRGGDQSRIGSLEQAEIAAINAASLETRPEGGRDTLGPFRDAIFAGLRNTPDYGHSIVRIGSSVSAPGPKGYPFDQDYLTALRAAYPLIAGGNVPPPPDLFTPAQRGIGLDRHIVPGVPTVPPPPPPPPAGQFSALGLGSGRQSPIPAPAETPLTPFGGNIPGPKAPPGNQFNIGGPIGTGPVPMTLPAPVPLPPLTDQGLAALRALGWSQNTLSPTFEPLNFKRNISTLLSRAPNAFAGPVRL